MTDTPPPSPRAGRPLPEETSEETSGQTSPESSGEASGEASGHASPGGLAPADHALVDAFLDGSLPMSAFDHVAHVRTAWALLGTRPLLEALPLFARSLQKLVIGYGKPGAYHETITWAYVLVIHERRRARPDAGWDAFSRANPDLLVWPSPILQRGYSPALLWSDEARQRFCLPDLVRS